MSESTRARAFLALCLARFRETYREPEVLFWAFVFPVLLSAALAVAFRDRPPEPSRAAVLRGPGAGRLLSALRGAPLVVVEETGPEAAEHALRMGRVDVVVSATADPAAPVEYRLDPSRPEAGIARARVDDALQRAAGRADPVKSRDVAASEPGGRYVDFLVPGLLGMNLMSAGMWGVGYALVDMRIKKLLKRLLATPMRAADFMAAQMTMRALSTFAEVGFFLGFAALVLGVPVRGSLAAVMAVALLGSMCFAGLGLAVGCRARKIETHEPRHPADVRGLGRLLLRGALPASRAAGAPGAAPHRAQRRAARADAGGGRPRLPVAAAPAAGRVGRGELRAGPAPLPLELSGYRGAGFAAGVSTGRSSAVTTRFRPPSFAA
jgi:ABC-2 type transport system permease protein